MTINMAAKCDVSVDDDTALTGADQHDDKGDNFGAPYGFTRTGSSWIQQTKLTAPDGAEGDSFGASVALTVNGRVALIGAHGDEDSGSDSGSAHVFRRSGSTWSLVVKLTTADGAADDRFGSSVALSGDTMFVGASVTTGSAVYVFDSSRD